MTHSSLSLCAMNFKFSITHDKNAEAKVHLIISEHYNKNKELCFTASQPLNLLELNVENARTGRRIFRMVDKVGHECRETPVIPGILKENAISANL